MAATPPPIIFKITDAGKNAALNGVDAGLSLNLAHLAIGSGKRAITGAETALKTEISRHPVISGDVETDSHTLRFSSTITASSITQVFELGLVTDDNVLFAVASTTASEPLITIHPDISFVGSFGLALDDVDAGSVTVTTDPNGALSLVIMENHLAAVDPHPQYLNAMRFRFLMQSMVPLGYIHHTHNAINPKPVFDELLGMDTQWRRLAGRIIVATDPNDSYIQEPGLVLGQKGMTEVAVGQRPHVYPLQTTHMFERYDPSVVVETVWNISANKNSVPEGGSISFTVSANNLPDGQILSWVVKEGVLNAGNNDIIKPEKTNTGTVILKNGQTTISFTTTPSDNTEEPQKHVRLTVGAPANLSINIPIDDEGFQETVIHISQSTYDGVVLDEYFKTQSGQYPTATDVVRFIVDSGVDIVAPSTTRGGIEEGLHWPAGSEIVIENHGRILGRGGDGGRSARVLGYLSDDDSDVHSKDIVPAEPGKDGGPAIKSLSKAISVENYSLIAGGGGGGGGQGLWSHTIHTCGGGGGTGGGAPFGKRSLNEGLYQRYVTDPLALQPRYVLPNDGRTYYSVDLQQNFAYLHGLGFDNEQDKAYTTPASKTRFIFVPLNDNGSANILGELEGEYRVRHTKFDLISLPLKTSYNATLLQGGAGGYGAGDNPGISFASSNPSNNNDMSLNHGGAGGDVGEAGESGVMNRLFDMGINSNKPRSEARLYSDNAAGGKAGLVFEGGVVVNNLAGGTTKGRMP